MALWDGFAQEEERRCSKIVMSMNGQLAYLGMSFTAFDAFAGHSNHSKQDRFASFSSGLNMLKPMIHMLIYVDSI